MHGIADPIAIIIHGLGLQLIFASDFYKPLPTLWYIGLILIYYYLFTALKISKINKVYKVVGIIVFPLMVFVASYYLGFIDFRLSLYYWTFLLGVLCAESQFFETNIFRRASVINSFVFMVLLVFCFFKQTIYGLDNSGDYLAINLFIISGVLFVYNVCTFLSKASSLGDFFKVISYSSYVMFLFHRPIWFALVKILQSLFLVNNLYTITTVLVIVGIPIIIGFSYFLQTFYDRYGVPFLYSNKI